ncbi:MAG: hypothetical protein UR30_C0019G0019, partial [Candidatus Peregrinibacteria bacterium GW2011_GWC2_33_13]
MLNIVENNSCITQDDLDKLSKTSVLFDLTLITETKNMGLSDLVTTLITTFTPAFQSAVSSIELALFSGFKLIYTPPTTDAEAKIEVYNSALNLLVGAVSLAAGTFISSYVGTIVSIIGAVCTPVFLNDFRNNVIKQAYDYNYGSQYDAAKNSGTLVINSYTVPYSFEDIKSYIEYSNVLNRGINNIYVKAGSDTYELVSYADIHHELFERGFLSSDSGNIMVDETRVSQLLQDANSWFNYADRYVDEKITDSLNPDLFTEVNHPYILLKQGELLHFPREGDDFPNKIYGWNISGETLTGSGGNDSLFGGSKNDIITGGGDSDYIDGGDGADSLTGSGLNDTIIGNDGNDVINGLGGNDSLVGGDNYDTYFTGGGNDIISDSDGDGKVIFGETLLKGGKQIGQSDSYKDTTGSIIYTKIGNDLVILKVGSSDSLTIEDYTNDDLGIKLEDGPPLSPPLRTFTTAEANALWYDPLTFWKPSNSPFSSSESIHTIDTLPWNIGLYNLNADPYGAGAWVIYTVIGNPPGVYCPTVTLGEILNNIGQFIQNTWKQLSNNPNDPILLDLDGDGVELVTTDNKVYFDLDKNGFSENTAWVNSDDGALVLDRNNNGIIDDGGELFGDQTLLADQTLATSGYEALAELDSNSDGVIDVNDTEFANLKVLKGDGTLLTLEEAGIKSLDLTYTVDNTTDTEGNTKLAIGSYTKTDDTTSEMSEFALHRHPFDSLATEWLDVPEEVAALPDVNGTGNTYWLSQAMVRDTSGELKDLVQQFVDEENPTTRDSLLEQILYKWTNVDSVNPTSRGDFDARKLGVIESFMGEYFQNSATSIPDAEDISSLENIYSTLKEQVYAQLMRQSHLSYLYDISFSYNEAGNNWNFNLEGAIGELQYEISQDNDAGKLMLREFTRTLTGLGLFNNAAASTFYNSFYYLGNEYRYAMDTATNSIIYGSDNADNLVGTDKNDALYGLDGNDSIIAGAGNDYLDGGAGNDTLLGGDGNDLISSGAGNNYLESNYIEGNAGDDTLIGSGGDDVLNGGAGNDSLIGGAGGDTYIFNGGQDVVNEYIPYSVVGGNDTLEFQGLSVNDVTFKGTPTGEIIAEINNTTDKITLHYQNYQNYQIEKFIFSDATLSLNDVINSLAINGTGGDDNITGSVFSEKIYGEAGNDNISAGYGNDSLEGNAGDDNLTGGAGNDVLVGGTGNDALYGGSDNDTYVFNIGDGQDIISDESGNDRIKFGTGITSSNIIVADNGADVIILIKNESGELTNDKITIANGLSSLYKIEAYEFADGSFLS